MPSVRLNDVALRALQPPPKGQIDFWDAEPSGLWMPGEPGRRQDISAQARYVLLHPMDEEEVKDISLTFRICGVETFTMTSDQARQRAENSFKWEQCVQSGERGCERCTASIIRQSTALDPSQQESIRYAVVHVVDDDEATRDLLLLLLKTVGLKAATYSLPSVFMEKFDPARPGCVVSTFGCRK